MISKPSISVIMPIHNGEKYLAEAIESILNQTLKDFEFIIINDGSKDATSSIVERYQKRDQRIIFIDESENKKLAFRRNQGIELAQGKYIAYMDGDDISLPHRLETQLAFMEANPSVAYCSSRSRLFGLNSGIRYDPEENAAIRLAMFYKFPLTRRICNVPSFIRRTVFDQFKNSILPSHYYIEDLRLQLNITLNSTLRFSCIPEVLLNRRIHATATTVASRTRQASLGNRLRLEATKDLLSRDEAHLYQQLLNHTLLVKNERELSTIKTVFNKLKMRCSQNIADQEWENLDRKDFELRLIFARIQQEMQSPVNF